MFAVLLIICFLASTAGAVVGFGGGVIIKPVLDAFGLMPAGTISFLSGCTVFAMSVASLIFSRGNEVKLEAKTSTVLALGAVAGGFAGTQLLNLVKTIFQSDQTLGGIQSIGLTVLNICVFVYVCRKEKLKSYHLKNTAVTVFLGACLGLVSAFIGIGGGPINVTALFLFFSMDAKQSAKNSLYIILFSQATRIITSLVTRTVPEFSLMQLVAMACGGILGARCGAAITKKVDNRVIEILLRVLIAGVTLISASNIVRYFC